MVTCWNSYTTERHSLKSPWSRKKRRQPLSRQSWNGLFTIEGRFRDGGIKFLKKARSGGIEPSIRADVWPFLLGVYDLNSSEEERNAVQLQKRNKYEDLRRQCQLLSSHCYQGNMLMNIDKINGEARYDFNEDAYSAANSEDGNPRLSLSMEGSDVEDQPVYDRTPDSASRNSDDEVDDEEECEITHFDAFLAETDSSDSESSYEVLKRVPKLNPWPTNSPSSKPETFSRTVEDYATWQRIIRVDAIRADPEWVACSPAQASVSLELSKQAAEAVDLKNYDHLEPCMIRHASRLVSVLEAYAAYDPEIGYCQGMSDLLSPILTVMEDDHDAFWCFVGFMRKARHNFRLDEIGIRRQLAIVSRIIRSKDAHLYRHLEKLQAEDCFFVYRMVLVLFRRELTFQQTVCLWEVMWADQAAIRAGIENSASCRMRLRAPPTNDLLLYAIAACVLQRRKLILEKYSTMDEIMRECNSMSGQLDVWRLLDDAHDLVVTLHDKV
ncbi:hypothetical protein HPP92_008690 [Vanilla planifolia]|uniref:Rab-GAP TBC domain-containing protein n=1 Tax=Vanilla planifolia TaxID=51239 RepID=A0A835V7G5_VANPL|nr:hypothetical protein HPP92_008690 [Vanilla planifolia]